MLEVSAFLRTALPLDLSQLQEWDSGRYHSIWLPDHMVSFWPDSIWTPEFTDLATISKSPHRCLDGLAVAAAVAVLTKNVPIVTSVVDTVRHHPSSLAQTALTIDHLSKGRFILGLGCGEVENIVPYGFDFTSPVGRFEEAIKIIRLLWESDGPVDFEGRFFKLHHARLDTEPFERRFPPIWVGASGPRMLNITGRYADGWWPAGGVTPEDYAAKLKVIRAAAESVGRDPLAVTPAHFLQCLVGDDAELAEMIQSPLLKSFILQVPSSLMRQHGYKHPLGEDWRGFFDINPAILTRERMLDLLDRIDPDSLLAVLPHGSPKRIAETARIYMDAGMRVLKIMDFGSVAGQKFAASSAQKVREVDDEIRRLTGVKA
jgi:phthiodiolone/phenolphthiodiolone dimycocerosates ketoreductase